ncbi:YqaJ viral recombinase family protein [Arthrobacter sp. R4]|uniref:YqaJ viral recombinase family protein n=1 Tax=Arthrobacter sp. R4 TaxID=644417 RepID=UPI003ED973D9
MSLEIFTELEQGSDEWLAARCGIVTASVVGQLVTSRQPTAIETDCPECGALTSDPCIGKRSPAPLKTLHPARAAAARGLDRVIGADLNSDTARGLALTLVAERITGHVEPMQVSGPMLRGQLDEPYARDAYSEHHAPADVIGFMVRDFGKYKLGYSPDGLVGDDGMIEIKSRAQKKHLATILADEVPAENMAQMQAGLLVSGRDWCDYVSFCSGMPLWTKRVEPNEKWFDAITDAALTFEANAAEMISTYNAATENLPPTERLDHFADIEIF